LAAFSSTGGRLKSNLLKQTFIRKQDAAIEMRVRYCNEHWSRREDRRWRSPVAIEGFGVRYQRLVLIGFA
jgi:hypothetical protein